MNKCDLVRTLGQQLLSKLAECKEVQESDSIEIIKNVYGYRFRRKWKYRDELLYKTGDFNYVTVDKDNLIKELLNGYSEEGIVLKGELRKCHTVLGAKETEMFVQFWKSAPYDWVREKTKHNRKHVGGLYATLLWLEMFKNTVIRGTIEDIELMGVHRPLKWVAIAHFILFENGMVLTEDEYCLKSPNKDISQSYVRDNTAVRHILRLFYWGESKDKYKVRDKVFEACGGDLFFVGGFDLNHTVLLYVLFLEQDKECSCKELVYNQGLQPESYKMNFSYGDYYKENAEKFYLSDVGDFYDRYLGTATSLSTIIEMPVERVTKDSTWVQDFMKSCVDTGLINIHEKYFGDEVSDILAEIESSLFEDDESTEEVQI